MRSGAPHEAGDGAKEYCELQDKHNDREGEGDCVYLGSEGALQDMWVRGSALNGLEDVPLRVFPLSHDDASRTTSQLENGPHTEAYGRPRE